MQHVHSTHEWDKDELEALTAWFGSIDVDRNGVISNTEAIEVGLEDLVRKYDKNKDGAVSFKELLVSLETAANTRGKEVDMFIRKIKEQHKNDVFKKDYCKVMFKYEGNAAERQLSLEKGDVVYIHSHHARGWAKGRVVRRNKKMVEAANSKMGYFPESYTRVCAAPKPPYYNIPVPRPKTLPSIEALSTRPVLLQDVVFIMEEKGGLEKIQKWAFESKGELGHFLMMIFSKASTSISGKSLQTGTREFEYVFLAARVLAAVLGIKPKQIMPRLSSLVEDGPVSPSRAARSSSSSPMSSHAAQQMECSKLMLTHIGMAPMLSILSKKTALRSHPHVLWVGMQVALRVLLHCSPTTINKAGARNFVEHISQIAYDPKYVDDLIAASSLDMEVLQQQQQEQRQGSREEGKNTNINTRLLHIDKQHREKLSVRHSRSEWQTLAVTLLMLLIHNKDEMDRSIATSLEAANVKQPINVGMMLLKTLFTQPKQLQITLSTTVASFVETVLNTPEYKGDSSSSSKTTSAKSDDQTKDRSIKCVQSARCLSRVCQWPKNSKNPSSSGPSFIRIAKKSGGDEEALDFLQTVFSQFCLVDGDLELCVTAEDIRSDPGKALASLLLQFETAADQSPQAWEKALRMENTQSGSIIPAIAELVIRATKFDSRDAKAVPTKALEAIRAFVSTTPDLTMTKLESNYAYCSALCSKLALQISQLLRVISMAKDRASKETAVAAATQCTSLLVQLLGRASTEQISKFFQERKYVDIVVDSMADLVQYQYPIIVNLVPRVLTLVQFHDPKKEVIEKVAQHKHVGMLSEAIAKVFLRPDEIIEIPIIKLIQEIFDSGNEGLFAHSDKLMLFQILVQKLGELVDFPGDKVLEALVVCYQSMIEWKEYAYEKPYHTQGISFLEDLLNNIGDNANTTRTAWTSKTVFDKLSAM
mmetsp:Transcript_22900/g.36791  ORF Transcript_22900/g.36791 Transcript_22900/m.36791 type:complete len:931 (+) Transcript_22900:92-2884(+)